MPDLSIFTDGRLIDIALDYLQGEGIHVDREDILELHRHTYYDGVTDWDLVCYYKSSLTDLYLDPETMEAAYQDTKGIEHA